MIEDFYRLAMAALRHHLEQAGVPFDEEDGDVVVNGHRLALSVNFEGFAQQGAQWIAPLDVQIHLDGDTGDRFRVGTLGVGSDQHHAMQSAIHEWHLLAGSPVLAALGAELTTRRGAAIRKLAGWDLFAGRMGVRGSMPAAMQAGGEFLRSLVAGLKPVVGRWEDPQRFTLRSLLIMASNQPDAFQVEGAVDGFVEQQLTEALQLLDWPRPAEPYFFKQMFVLRSGSL